MNNNSANADTGRYLGKLTWVEAEHFLRKKPVVVIPFAAGAKEHGPHLPMQTDQLVMEHLLDAAVAERHVLVVPPVLHGWFPAFEEFPGTFVDSNVFQSYLFSIAQSLVNQGVEKIVFLNLGIAKATGLPLSVVARDLRATPGVQTLVVSWDDLETIEANEWSEQERGGHADEMETSIILYLARDQVQMDKAKKDYRGTKQNQIGYAPGKFEKGELGVFGDPTLATADKGEKMFDLMRKNWLLALQQFAQR